METATYEIVRLMPCCLHEQEAFGYIAAMNLEGSLNSIGQRAEFKDLLSLLDEGTKIVHC